MTPAFLSFPDADAVFTVATPDGVTLPVYELKAKKPSGKVLLLGHANGLAAGSYAPWLKDLARDLHIFAYDQRGHGGSTWPEGKLDEIFAAPRYADDLRQIMDVVAQRSAGEQFYYLGHSLGAFAGLDLAIERRLPDLAGMMLIEPPVFPSPDTKSHAVAAEIQPRLIAGASRRRADWPSVEAFIERLRNSKSLFGGFTPAMLDAHCHATLRPKDGGGFTLCCPPAIESAVFAGYHFNDTWDKLHTVDAKMELVGGDPALIDLDWIAAAMIEMAPLMKNAHLVTMKDLRHLMIQEAPDQLLALVRNWIGLK